ncbi:hypothetical protein QBC45DRAFT_318283, partial [Copromyces sp. CBS 386.78]
LNTAYINTIKANPHEYLFNHKLASPLDLLTKPEEVNDHQILRKHIREDTRLAINFTIANTKRRYNTNHRQIQLEIGDKIFLKLYKGYYLLGRPSKKIS